MDKILVDWANTVTEKPDQAYNPVMGVLIERSDASILRLVKLHPEFFPAKMPRESWELIYRVRVFLRLAWDAPDLREREWHIFEARRQYYFETIVKPMGVADFGLVISPPPFSQFEQVMYRFHVNADRARHCGNAGCETPYFFAVKRGNKYCSPECALPSQREFKRNWWRENRAGGKK